MRGEVEPRIKSRDYIFIPGRTYDEEFGRYMRAYIEESIIIGPHKFLSDEFIPYIPFEAETGPAKKQKKKKKKKKSKAASSPAQ